MPELTKTTGRGAMQTLNLRIGQRVDNSYALRYLTGPTTDRAPVNLTGWTARAQIRPNLRDTAWLTLTSSSGGGITLGADGRITLTIPAKTTRTDEWDRRDTGVWDLVLTNPSGATMRLVSGTVTVSHQVTRDAG